ncbi:type VI secretion system baseplate subunit TssF [Chitinibacter bivalviorum]|uniref:type VI secretion system baseplate subunit TssF n=1 Tax=Chitinibacter bivalviorum TaxID=2739434 RepID=UPI002483F9AC|nr:type VI secretion system baseplate subunit TssF [Chitinibacter bivalviorum]
MLAAATSGQLTADWREQQGHGHAGNDDKELQGNTHAGQLSQTSPYNEIARRTSLTRNTIKKWLRTDSATEPRYRRKSSQTKLSPFIPQLVKALQTDLHRPKRDRRTAKVLFQELVTAGFGGDYSRVTAFIRHWRTQTMGHHLKSAFVPLRFALGEAFQFDWSEEHAFIGGIHRKVLLAHMKLCASRAFALMAYPSQSHEMLFDAHTRAFQMLGGVPLRGIYDNMKTAVDKVLPGKERIINARFHAMTAHYLFDTEFCNVASGWEKGIVEKNVQDRRRHIWQAALALKFASFDELNAWLEQQCQLAWQQLRHPEYPELTLAELRQDEQLHMMPFPGAFDGYTEVLARVSSTCLITFQRNRYSVPCHWANQMVSVQQGEPIRVTHHKASYPVVADARKQQAFEVMQIRKVIRIEKTGSQERSEEVLPFYALRHGAENDGPDFYWHASREASPRQDDKGTDLELHLVDLNFNPVRPSAEVLSLELLCSNRDLPELIPFGGSQAGSNTDFTLPGHSVVKRVKLLRKPTGSLRTPNKRGLQWRLVSHLSLNYLSLIESGRSALQEMLSLYNQTDSPVNARQIQGLYAIESAPAVTRVSGRNFSGFVRGTDITLTMDGEYYVGGSIYLFASALERFFALYCSPNSFTRLCIKTKQQNGVVASWPARAGEALVI